MKTYIGVDCGATYLRVGIVQSDGKLLASLKSPSPLKSEPERLAITIREQLKQLQSSHNLSERFEAMGVGTPGPLDLEKGMILPSSNLGNQGPIDLKRQFDKEFNIEIYFGRDTELALLGEAWQGAAVGKKDVVMLTLGSGVGGAVMIDGEIESGAHGKAGEIGHMIVSAAGKGKSQKCGLGHEGCLEALINSAEDLEKVGTYLGYGLANIVDIFNPQMIVIGGGKVYQGDFLPKAVGVMKSMGMKPAVDEVEVVYAKLGQFSGVYGGAKLALSLTAT